MRPIALVLVALACAALAACGFERGPDEIAHARSADPEVFGAENPAARFMGSWVVDELSDIHWASSYYKFAEHRELDFLGNASVNPSSPVGVVTGHDEPCPPNAGCPLNSFAVRCVFGSRWVASDSETLHVDGVCDDDQAREITLTFDGPLDGDEAGGGNRNVTAALEGYLPTHSGHPGYDWRFKRCRDADGEWTDDTASVGPCGLIDDAVNGTP